MHHFEPTLQAAHERLAAVKPEDYARTRNALDGAVTRLSPYLTHGFLSLQAVFLAVHQRHPLEARHKFVFELGWRAYYRHVWAHLGDGIHQSRHPGLLPDAAYSQAMPDDVRQARTGIAAIDLAVQTLYSTGYLHNHARMWLASYLVHLRKVHWHVGAQWMYGHLLDGDLASNHLSWQWIAGTGSHKPYLFNAENVAKFAPPPWHSPGTVIDTSYEAMDRLARAAAPSRRARQAADEGVVEPPCDAAPPEGSGWTAPESGTLSGQDVWLVHPWSLAGPPPGLAPGTVVIGIALVEFHSHYPWTARRWDFVSRAMAQHTDRRWYGDASTLAHALQGARSVQWQSEPHFDATLPVLQDALAAQPAAPEVLSHSPASLFEPVTNYCDSFSRWWNRTRLVLPESPSPVNPR